MAEVWGIIASVIAVAQLTGQVASLGYSYLSGVKKAPKDLADLVEELDSLKKVLITLKDYLDKNAQSPALQALNDAKGPIRVCALELKILQAKLEPRKGFRGMIGRLKWPIKEHEIAEYKARIERQKSLFILALAADQISLAKEIGAYAQDTNSVVHNSQTQSNDERQKKDDLLRGGRKKRVQVLDWLTVEDFERKHTEISNRRQEGTGGWLLETPEFQTLNKKHPDQSLLWGFGIPGAGKTFLSSVVIDHFKQKAKKENSGIAYIYFDYKDKEQQGPVQVLASLVKQLVSQIQHLPTDLERLYDELVRKRRRPTVGELYSALLASFESFEMVFLVFDALDECDQRKGLLPLLHRMGKGGANLFVTSRQHPEDIQASFHSSAKIKLSAQDNDIRIYIEQKISEHSRARRLVQQARCQDKIVSELIDCAQGMFLLVHFHIEHLCQQATAKQILIALEGLKRSSAKGGPLGPTYDRAMETLRSQPKSCADLGLAILSWLVKAKRTLTIEELQVAVSVEPNRYELDELDLPDKATILDICAGLVVIEEHTKTIRLAHYTVQEYLLKNPIIPADADFKLAMACTTFLSFDIFAGGAFIGNDYITKSKLESCPFLEYAALQLSHHLRACDEHLTADLVLRFLSSRNSIATYIQSLGRSGSHGFSFWRDSSDCELSPLQIASYLGHLTVVQLLLDQGVNPSTSKIGRMGWTPLHFAVSEGWEKVVQLLLNKGADCSPQDADDSTLLHEAAFKGWGKVVQLLLDKGADCSAKDYSDRIPLHLAASMGYRDVVELLIENGSDLSARDFSCYSVLSSAVWGGFVEVVRLLLEKGACPEATALQNAAFNGHEAIVHLLLEKGLDPTARGRDGETVLHHAAKRGHNLVVQHLLDKGAKPSAPNYQRNTPLHYAAFEGHEIVAQTLLERDDDVVSTVSVQNGEGQTALHYAALHGDEAIARLLLDKGAKPSTTNRRQDTPLHYATLEGHEMVVKLLLERDAGAVATVLVQNDEGMTALHYAALHGDEAIAQLLLDKGAKPSVLNNQEDTPFHNALSRGNLAVVQLFTKGPETYDFSDKCGITPLHIAASRGNLEFVQFLLRGGANLSKKDDRGDTALCNAASLGHQAVVQLLLENGANLSVSDNLGNTALHQAARRGHTAVVNLLLENGVEWSVRNGAGDTALHQAASNGHATVVQLLLDNLKGADWTVQNNGGDTALHQAAGEGQYNVLKMLLQTKVDFSIHNTFGSTPLHYAAWSGYLEVTHLLLLKGFNPFFQDSYGNTVLHTAACRGMTSIVQLLLKTGVDVSVSNKEGDTALHYAAWNGHEPVFRLLLDKFPNPFILNSRGNTPLHIAAWKGNRKIVNILLELLHSWVDESPVVQPVPR